MSESSDITTQIITPEQVEKIRADLQNGVDIEAICMKLGLANVQAVTALMKNQKTSDYKNMSHSEILNEQKYTILDMIDTAKYQYIADATDRNAYAVTALQQTLLAIIQDIEKRKDPTSMYKDILSKVIKPLLEQLIKTITLESGKMRDSLFNQLPPDKHNLIKYSVESLMRGFGVSAETSYRNAGTHLKDVLGLNDDGNTTVEGLSKTKEVDITPPKE